MCNVMQIITEEAIFILPIYKTPYSILLANYLGIMKDKKSKRKHM